MSENDFEGSIVLEKLAEIGKVDEFFDSVDSDDFGRVKSLMQAANCDSEDITMVLKKMGDTDGEH